MYVYLYTHKQKYITTIYNNKTIPFGSLPSQALDNKQKQKVRGNVQLFLYVHGEMDKIVITLKARSLYQMYFLQLLRSFNVTKIIPEIYGIQMTSCLRFYYVEWQIAN